MNVIQRLWTWRKERKLARKKREAEKRQRKGELRYWTETIGSIVLAVFLIRAMVVEAYRIPSSSMEKTLLIGDFLLVNKFVYGMKTPDWVGVPLTRMGFEIPHFQLPSLSEPKTGDVIVFKYPLDPATNFIKRCIAGPGQTVEVVDNRVYVDGEEFERLPHQQERPGIKPAGREDPGIRPRGSGYNTDNYGPVKVPEGHYFMMGDNRDNSSDSRFWGFVPRENIVGKAWIIYFSFNAYELKRRIWRVIRWDRLLNAIR